MKHSAMMAGCVLGGLIIVIFGWREFRHREIQGEHAALEGNLLGKIHNLEAKLEEASAQTIRCEASIKEMEIELQSRADRCANLSAQRDHLRAESERQSTLAKERSEALAMMEKDLQATRHELLLKAAAPRTLEAEISRKDARIQELESLLDRQSAMQAVHPDMYAVEGISSDGSVLLLSGNLDISLNFPTSIRLCRKNEVLLNGWINRIEDSRIIVHTGEWQVSPSALVKGEKVFILPGRYHDSDP